MFSLETEVAKPVTVDWALIGAVSEIAKNFCDEAVTIEISTNTGTKIRSEQVSELANDLDIAVSKIDTIVVQSNNYRNYKRFYFYVNNHIASKKITISVSGNKESTLLVNREIENLCKKNEALYGYAYNSAFKLFVSALIYVAMCGQSLIEIIKIFAGSKGGHELITAAHSIWVLVCFYLAVFNRKNLYYFVYPGVDMAIGRSSIRNGATKILKETVIGIIFLAIIGNSLYDIFKSWVVR